MKDIHNYIQEKLYISKDYKIDFDRNDFKRYLENNGVKVKWATSNKVGYITNNKVISWETAYPAFYITYNTKDYMAFADNDDDEKIIVRTGMFTKKTYNKDEYGLTYKGFKNYLCISYNKKNADAIIKVLNDTLNEKSK